MWACVRHYPSDKCFFIHLHLNAVQTGKQKKNRKCNIYKSITLVWYIVSIRLVYVACVCVWVDGCVCLNASKCFSAVCWQYWLLNKNHLPAIFVPSKIADYRLHGKERKGAVKLRMMAYLSRCNTYLQMKNDWWHLIMSFRAATKSGACRLCAVRIRTNR